MTRTCVNGSNQRGPYGCGLDVGDLVHLNGDESKSLWEVVDNGSVGLHSCNVYIEIQRGGVKISDIASQDLTLVQAYERKHFDWLKQKLLGNAP